MENTACIQKHSISFDNLQISKSTGFGNNLPSYVTCLSGPAALAGRPPHENAILLSPFLQPASIFFAASWNPHFFKTWFSIVACLDFGEILLLASDLTFTLLFNLAKKNYPSPFPFVKSHFCFLQISKQQLLLTFVLIQDKSTSINFRQIWSSDFDVTQLHCCRRIFILVLWWTAQCQRRVL